MREGRIFVRDDGDGDCFIDECVALPLGRCNDEVDCLSLIGRLIDRLTAPVVGWPRLPDFADWDSVWAPGMSSGLGLLAFSEGGRVLED